MDYEVHKPTNYSLGQKATFDNTKAGVWIVSKSENRPLEVINKKDKLHFWDWEPWRMVKSYLLTPEEFNAGDFYHLVAGGNDVSSRQKDVDSK